MRKHLSLAILLLTLPPAAWAQRSPQGPSGPGPLPTQGLRNEALPPGETFEAIAGGRGSTLVAPVMQLTAVPGPGVYQLDFDDPGTGWIERVVIGVPTAPLTPAPLLVLFHGYGGTEHEVHAQTSFFQEARDRGWFVIAPLGAHQFNFGVPYAQENVAYVLDWLLNSVQIDRQRIYGVGFSMGGGWALSMAARHLDPDRAMFAAVVNHTGTASLSHVWWNSANPSLLHHPQMFGGPPSVYPFAYQQVSTIEVDPVTAAVNPINDMARNLKHVVTRTWNATQDPLNYLVVQSGSLVSWLAQNGHQSQHIPVRSTQHTWSILNETAVLNDLAQHVLTVPTTGTRKLLADRPERYLFFDVVQDAAGAFTPWRYNLDPAANRVVIDQGQNLARLTLHTVRAGLDPTQPLTVVIGISDGSQDQIVLRDYPVAPQNVTRANRSTSSWVHDPVAQTLTLFEHSGAGYPSWRIFP
jgi:poly(3-hydroxybutyrate) depolymerase